MTWSFNISTIEREDWEWWCFSGKCSIDLMTVCHHLGNEFNAIDWHWLTTSILPFFNRFVHFAQLIQMICQQRKETFLRNWKYASFSAGYSRRKGSFLMMIIPVKLKERSTYKLDWWISICYESFELSIVQLRNAFFVSAITIEKDKISCSLSALRSTIMSRC